jgi:hypothetical protein
MNECLEDYKTCSSQRVLRENLSTEIEVEKQHEHQANDGDTAKTVNSLKSFHYFALGL